MLLVTTAASTCAQVDQGMHAHYKIILIVVAVAFAKYINYDSSVKVQ